MNPAPRRVAIIYNPTAGWRRRRRLDRVLARLRALGCEVALHETRAKGDAEGFARGIDAAAHDAVVAAGGDGTINEVANGLAASGLPLGIVPLGTANVLAAELDLPADASAIADVIAFGRPMKTYPGRANGRLFLMMAGIGFDARVVEGVDLGLKRMTGKGAYVASALGALARHRAGAYEIEIDGAANTAAAAIIAKGHFYGGRFVVAQAARLAEPLFQVALFAKGGRFDVLRCAVAVAMGRIGALDDVRIVPARTVRVSGPAGEGVQLDGDLVGVLPFEASVAAEPIALLR
jgi:diacylglycerol kinase (ATP)